VIISRRSLIKGIFAAPAIIAAERLMPVRLWKPEPPTILFWRASICSISGAIIYHQDGVILSVCDLSGNERHLRLT
jgi:hypothetical protein